MGNAYIYARARWTAIRGGRCRGVFLGGRLHQVWAIAFMDESVSAFRQFYVSPRRSSRSPRVRAHLVTTARPWRTVTGWDIIFSGDSDDESPPLYLNRRARRGCSTRCGDSTPRAPLVPPARPTELWSDFAPDYFGPLRLAAGSSTWAAAGLRCRRGSRRTARCCSPSSR